MRDLSQREDGGPMTYSDAMTSSRDPFRRSRLYSLYTLDHPVTDLDDDGLLQTCKQSCDIDI
jgi:hypothetical protein